MAEAPRNDAATGCLCHFLSGDFSDRFFFLITVPFIIDVAASRRMEPCGTARGCASIIQRR